MGAEREPGTVEKVRKLQLAGGPVGRLVLVTVIAVMAIAVIALLAADVIRFFCLLAVVGLAGFAIAKILNYARESPANAALDGAEITQYRQCLGTKSEPKILATELVADVVRAPEGAPAPSGRSPDSAATPTSTGPTLPEPSEAPEPESDTESNE